VQGWRDRPRPSGRPVTPRSAPTPVDLTAVIVKRSQHCTLIAQREHLGLPLKPDRSRMGVMKKSSPAVVALLIVLGFGLVGLANAQDDDGPMSDLRFVVVRDYNGKPVRNAAVVLHPVSKKGKQARGGLELKTDNDGKTNIDGIPYGPLRIQVLAPGYQTFGEDYRIDKPQMEITVKLKRPGGQYSVYENHADAKKPDDQKPAEAKPQQ
jgi:hypothetical protein